MIVANIVIFSVETVLLSISPTPGFDMVDMGRTGIWV